MNAMLFGDDTAENDPLLYDCGLSPASHDQSKQIVSGRWGVGKTAYLLLANADLSRRLLDINQDLERIWLVDEKSIDTTVLIKEFHKSQFKQEFRRNLESMWKAEIVRRAAIILASLMETYGAVSGGHWKFINQISRAHRVATPIWLQIPNVFKLLTGFDQARVDSVEALQGQFEDLFTESAYKCIQRCLADIKAVPLQPVVAIEPIDTPTSSLEVDCHLAQEVVTALLNVFVAHFRPSPRQLLYVLLSVPWHRFNSDHIDFPQKLSSFVTVLHWREPELRQFINRRIAWEFRRVGRPFTPSASKDEWSALFEDKVRNSHCDPAVHEESFAYVLRHTQHRPRQLQQIARAAVEGCAAELQRSQDEILRGRGGIRIHGNHIARAVASKARDVANHVTTEAGRRYPGFRDVVDALKGIAVPFTVDDLSLRLRKISQLDLPTTVDMLYQAGLIGVQICAQGKDIGKAVFPSETKKIDINQQNETFERSYFFEYLWSDGSGGYELYQRYREHPKLDVSLVLHPATYEYLLPGRVIQSYPIGV